jgi:hypothetical protein
MYRVYTDIIKALRLSVLKQMALVLLELLERAESYLIEEKLLYQTLIAPVILI